MIYSLLRPVSSQKIAVALGLEHQGESVDVKAVAPLDETGEGVISFAVLMPEKVISRSVLISTQAGEKGSWLIADNPRLTFIRFLNWLKKEQLFAEASSGSIAASAEIAPSATIGTGAVIGENCTIGPNACIHNDVVIGNNVRIGAGTVIGHDGFGYERDELGSPVQFPHLGRVVIKSNVTIGNQCSISRGVLQDTVIGEGTAIDDQCYIAHNVEIANDVLIMSGVRLNGRVKISSSSWLGTAAIVREGCIVAEKAMVGMGSVVTKSVASGATVYGNPAKMKKN